MIVITHEQAQEMYQNLQAKSFFNAQSQMTRKTNSAHGCPSLPRGNVQARVTGVISVKEHYRIVNKGDADMRFLENSYR